MNVEGEEVEESRAKLQEGFLVTAKELALTLNDILTIVKFAL